MAASAVSFLAMAVVALVLHAAAAAPPPAPPTPTGGQPSSCASTLYDLWSCLPFLSSSTALAGPPPTCCAPLRAVLMSPDAICLCHAIGGGVNSLAHVNIDPIRLALLPIVCFAIVPPQLATMCLVGPVPPITTIDQPRAPQPAVVMH
ncbi:hypothetical protein BS78_02G370500 [Paspalum vaginatum]|nr:hypothetical protein BS78_02G370500 [Paspalum vaginatum]